ncbi:MAG: hypothetical protein JO348_14715, partial [Alphaproteobacteria bacterium]|nr:hypothetical protein [Alphaproteobacteria bacterium]
MASTAALLPFQARADICRDGAANAADIRWLLGQIAANYAYLPDRKVDLQKVRALYEPQAAAVCDAHAFLNVLERLLAEFHDHHMEPGVNNAHSPQLVPSGTDIWASMHAGRARIEQVRPGSAAARASVRNGDEIVSIGDASAADAVAAHAPLCLSEPDPEAANYTLRVLLAGTHDAPRDFTVRTKGGAIRAIDLPPFQQQQARAPLTIRRLNDILCLRIENSLGDLNLIPAIDAALDAPGDARALILDLRNTPSGGTTDIAEPILGRFITGRPNYQRVFKPAPGKRFPQDSTLRWVRS